MSLKNSVVVFSMMVLLILVVAPIGAQTLDGTTGGDATSLQSGGGDTQFPEGTDNCSGDRNHHAHDYPPPGCSKLINPHYSAYHGQTDPCSQRTKHCSACNGCCEKQTEEAKTCFCPDSACRTYADYAERVCKDVCVGEYLDGCA